MKKGRREVIMNKEEGGKEMNKQNSSECKEEEQIKKEGLSFCLVACKC